MDVGTGDFGEVGLQGAFRCEGADGWPAPAAVAGFQQRHRADAQSGHAAGTGVAGEVVGGDGGAGEDELAGGAAAPVDFVPYVVPQLGLDLPLVDEPGGSSR